MKPNASGTRTAWWLVLLLSHLPFSACLDQGNPDDPGPITFGDVVTGEWAADESRSAEFLWRGNVTKAQAEAGFTLPSLPYVVTVKGQHAPGSATLWMNKTIQVNGQRVYGLVKTFDSSSFMINGSYVSNASAGDPHPSHSDDAKQFQIQEGLNEVTVTVQLKLDVRQPGSNLFLFQMGPGRVFHR